MRMLVGLLALLVARTAVAWPDPASAIDAATRDDDTCHPDCKSERVQHAAIGKTQLEVRRQTNSGFGDAYRIAARDADGSWWAWDGAIYLENGCGMHKCVEDTLAGTAIERGKDGVAWIRFRVDRTKTRIDPDTGTSTAQQFPSDHVVVCRLSDGECDEATSDDNKTWTATLGKREVHRTYK